MPVNSERTSARIGSARGARSATRTSARYWVCLALLVASAASMGTLKGWFGWAFRKQAVPLRLPLAHFDARSLGSPYARHVSTDQLEPIKEDMIQSLGTDEYLQIRIVDESQPSTSPTRMAHLFVTYYTGQPDLVPHVPEECYLAGGYEPVGLPRTVNLHVAGVGAPDDEVPVRAIEFRARQQAQMPGGGANSVTVMYLFHANGRYATTRNGVRMLLTRDLLQHYAYYAKIEVTFMGADGRAQATPEDSLAALAPLLERVLAVLLRDHFDLGHFTAGSPADN